MTIGEHCIILYDFIGICVCAHLQPIFPGHVSFFFILVRVCLHLVCCNFVRLHHSILIKFIHFLWRSIFSLSSVFWFEYTWKLMFLLRVLQFDVEMIHSFDTESIQFFVKYRFVIFFFTLFICIHYVKRFTLFMLADFGIIVVVALHIFLVSSRNLIFYKLHCLFGCFR